MPILRPDASSSASKSPDELGPGDEAPGAWATFARNALHDATGGWDDRVGALGQGAVCELRQLSDVLASRKSWREAGDEARRMSRDALASSRRSREAGNRAYPFAASAGVLPAVRADA